MNGSKVGLVLVNLRSSPPPFCYNPGLYFSSVSLPFPSPRKNKTPDCRLGVGWQTNRNLKSIVAVDALKQ